MGFSGAMAGSEQTVGKTQATLLLSIHVKKSKSHHINLLRNLASKPKLDSATNSKTSV